MAQQLKGYTISFQLYAFDEKEVEECRQSIINFIRQHAQAGRAVTAEKVGRAVAGWESNPIIKNQIILLI